jgi:hypothetical protein
MMGLVPQARYLTSNSGGSWFNSAFSYQVGRPRAFGAHQQLMHHKHARAQALAE